MSEQIHKQHVAIVLHRPRYPENIGAAARAMWNMGFNRLIVVEPDHFDLLKVFKMATHAAAHIVKQIQVFDRLTEALSSFHYVAATTARTGKHRQPASTPKKAAEKLIALSQNNQIAIVFGPEDRGLSNEDVRQCNELITIPSAEFSSLNLAQAVMIICYELLLSGTGEGDWFIPRLANRREMNEMYDQLKDVLLRISFINPQNPDYWMNNLRQFFDRFPLRAKEVRIIRGICRQIDWYGKRCFQDGRAVSNGVCGSETDEL